MSLHLLKSEAVDDNLKQKALPIRSDETCTRVCLSLKRPRDFKRCEHAQLNVISVCGCVCVCVRVCITILCKPTLFHRNSSVGNNINFEKLNHDK